MNVVKFTKFQYAMLNVFGYMTSFLGTLYYNMYLKDKEFRLCFKYACVVGVLGSVTSLIFVLRWNLEIGISDTIFIMLSDIVVGTLSLAYTMLPLMVLFAKITP